MRARHILGLGTFLSILVVSPAHAEPAPVARVVLVGAHWCAPCRAELPRLAALAAAARPATLALGWTDRLPMLPAAARTAVEGLPPATARTLLERHAQTARGLPFALAYTATGTLCALWRGPLTEADWPALAARCTAG